MPTTQFNLADAFETVAGVHPDRECVIWGDKRLTFSELADRSRRLGAYLRSRGLGAHAERSELAGHESGQDHLGIYLYNGNEYLEAMIGAFMTRVAPFNVNYRYVADELLYLLDNSQCRALVYHAAFAPTLAEVRDRLPRLEVLIQVADDSGNDLLPGAVDYETVLAATDPVIDVRPSPDDLYILYTGGTTGMPKGVLWRQHDIFLSAMGGRNILSQEKVESYDDVAAQARAFAEPLRFFVIPPLMHGAAQWVAFIALNNGHAVVLPPDTRTFDPAEAWRTIERERCTTLTTVGDAIARPLVEELEAGSYDTSSLLSVGNGGAPLTPTIKARLIEQLPHVLLTDAVGSSETGAQMNHLSTAEDTSSGRFNPGPGTVVVSEDLDKVLEPGHDGIGWLAQTGWVPLGYFADPDKTARTFPVIDGVRYSVPGDRARLLANGEIELLGRDSVTINSGGEKIFAEEVERAIAGHPAVHDVVVVGRASERWGQEVVALVELSEGAEATPDDVVTHAAQHVARYKLPKDVLFLDAIQRSPSGKADYRWAKAQVQGADA
ncbi:MAG TPA: acyl-CoA synthetase [Acidimicrobiales bacterium]|nr:acyl-CoA synthetase [Acidimicrobiales bacterium]